MREIPGQTALERAHLDTIAVPDAPIHESLPPIGGKPAPARVRLSRARGYRLQHHAPGAIVVARAAPWGNPFIVPEALEDEPDLTPLQARQRCVEVFDLWLEGDVILTHPRHVERRAWILANLGQLAGHPLACWCPLPAPGQPDWCHAAVLIRRAAALAGRTTQEA